MASGGNAGSVEEEVARWTRVGEVGLEEGLREIGCTEKAIAESLSCLRASQYDNIAVKCVSKILAILRKENSKDAPAVLFATLGRGTSSHVNWITVDTDHICYEEEVIALIVNLTSNTNIESLRLRGDNEYLSEHIPLLATAVKVNSTFRQVSYDWGRGGDVVRCLVDGFKANEALKLEELDMSYSAIGDDGVVAVADILTTNVTIKTLDLNKVSCGFQGAMHMAAALEQNSTLQHLNFGCNKQGTDGMKRLLEPLSGKPGGDGSPSNGPKNTTLRTLDLSLTKPEHFCAESVALMIKTNRSLRKLDLAYIQLPPEHWTEHLFPALKENDALETLDLYHCKGLTEDAYQVLLDALTFSATALKDIDLSRTEIQSKQGSVEEELRINRAYRSRLRSQPQVRTTSGRLVLCGYQFAGKTAIRKTIERIARGSGGRHHFRVTWKKAMRVSPGLRRLVFSRDAHRELTTRTRGFDILVLENHSPLAAVWDFAGQREYYALHDYLFPNLMNSCFLYVCSPWYPPDGQSTQRRLKSLNSMREECEYWLRFIASNSKPVPDSRDLPRVRFVLSHKDALDPADLSTSQHQAENVVRDLKHKFQDVIALCETVEVVDANSTGDVKHLINLTDLTLEEILEHQTEYDVCKVICRALKTWCTKHPSRLSMTLEEFYVVCREEVRRSTLKLSDEVNLFSSEGRTAILAYLNDTGDIIFRKGLDFIVLDPRWFGVGVLGSLIDAFGVVGSSCDQSSVSGCANVLSQ